MDVNVVIRVSCTKRAYGIPEATRDVADAMKKHFDELNKSRDYFIEVDIVDAKLSK